MDPVTHGLVGAAIGWAVGGGALGRRALVVGAAAGLLPDVDVLIRSASDPLLAIEHHRGFTHSIAFSLIGGSIAGLALGARSDRSRRRSSILAGIAAWISHAFLDAATTYGTQLFWPFSRVRVGLDIISIIDPLFTLFAIIAVVASFRGRRALVNAMLALAAVWLVVGLVQRERAAAAQTRLAHARGDRVIRAAVFPTIGNTIVWRSIYATDAGLRMDRLRVPWFGGASSAAGPTVPLASPEEEGRTPRDFERFAWYSDGWIARDPGDASVIGDARYSLHADRYAPVWGIRLEPAEWVDRSRQRRVAPADVWRAITGEDPAFRDVP